MAIGPRLYFCAFISLEFLSGSLDCLGWMGATRLSMDGWMDEYIGWPIICEYPGTGVRTYLLYTAPLYYINISKRE